MGPKTVLRPALLVLLVGGLAPRAAALDPSRALTQYAAAVHQEGLPQLTVTSIAQTPDGFVWLGTQEGLVRFDGVQFEVFDRRRVPELPSRWVVSLLAGRDGSLWVGTAEGLVHRLPGGAFVRVADGERVSPRFRRLARDPSGTVWAATDVGLMRFEGGRRSVDVPPPLAGIDDPVRTVATGSDGSLWWADGLGNLARRRPDGNVRVWHAGQEIPALHPSAIVADGADSAWVATIEGRLLRVAPAWVTAFGPDHGLPAARMVSLLLDRHGNLWIGTYSHGLVRYAGGRFESHGPGGLPVVDAESLLEDADGNLLVGTIDSGLVRLRDAPFEVFGQPEGMEADNVRSVLAEADGSVLVGGSGVSGPGLWRIAGGRVTRLGLPGEAATVTSLLRDLSGTLWIGTGSSGLLRWDGKRAPVRVGADDGLGSSHVTAIAEEAGTLWVGTESEGLRRVRDGKLLPPGGEKALLGSWVTAIVPAPGGGLWVATNGRGLARLSGDAVTWVRKEHGLPSEGLLALHEDRDGDLWIGTVSAGLARLSGGRIARVTVAEGLFDDTTFGIAEDREGNLWLTSNRGVTRVTRRSLLDVLAGRGQRVAARFHGRADGLRTSECNGSQQPSLTVDARGRVWVATVKGAASVDPRVEAGSHPLPATLVVGVEADGVPLSGSPIPDVPPGTGRLEVRFTAPDLSDPGSLRFQHRLEGFDTRWIDSQDRRTASYTAVPPGRYRFRVRASEEGRPGTGPEAEVILRFAPRLVQTPAFLGLCAVAVLLAALGGIRLRERRLRQRQRELAALVEERTAEARKLSRAVEQSPASVLITDRSGRIEYVNPAYERVTGWTSAEVLGQSPRILRSGIHGQPFYEELWRTVLRGETWHGELCNRRKDGTLFWESASISPVRGRDGEVTHFVAVKLDISDVKAFAAQLEKAKEAAEEASGAKSAFLASMSHEIRTPMNAVLGLTRLALEGPLTPEQRHYLTTARASGEHLLGLIDQVLDLSRIEARRLELHPAPVELRALLGEVRAVLSPRADEKGLELSVRVDRALPAWVTGDPLRLRQVLLNLGGNAVKFTESGSVLLQAVPAPAGGDLVLLQVVDTGAGIPEEVRDRVFERFVQADASATRKHGGSGLGLAISRELVGLMGGEIGVESRAGAGSTFWFTVPLPAVEAPVQPPASAPAGRKRSLRILVVEDNRINMLVATRTLALLGHEPVAAASGAEALEALGTGAPFDVALVDLHMPEMDGVELTRRIRLAEAGTGRRLPLLALTADARRSAADESLESGMDGVLTKPLAPETLAAALEGIGSAGERGKGPAGEASLIPVARRGDGEEGR